MANITPTSLPRIQGWWPSVLEYRYRQTQNVGTTNEFFVYSLWNTTSSAWQHTATASAPSINSIGIYVNASHAQYNVWQDGSANADPSYVWKTGSNMANDTNGYSGDISLFDSAGTQELYRFTKPAVPTSGTSTLSTVIWTPNQTGNLVANGTGRICTVSFGNNYNAQQNYQVVDVNNANKVHHSFTVGANANIINGQWLIDTDASANSAFKLNRITQGGYHGGSYTPSGNWYPAVSSVNWGSLTGTSGSAKNFEIDYTHGNGLYWDAIDGDEIRMVDTNYVTNPANVPGSNNNVYFTYVVTANLIISSNNKKSTGATGNGVDAFGPTEYGSKTFVLQIRNATHNNTTNWNNLQAWNAAGTATADVTQTFTNSAPYSISGITWNYTNNNGNTVQVDFTQNNWTNEIVELWYKDTSNQHHAQTANNVGGSQITWNLLASGASDGEYYLKVGSNYWPATNYYSNTYSYTPLQYSISNPVWQPQNGNVISVDWTETNPPPATAVELWKTNGSSAISSSTTGGPLTYTLQSSNDTGTYELKYNGSVVANSTSGTFTYQSSSYITWGTPTWTVTGYNTAATIECVFTYTNVGISGGNAAQTQFRYKILNSNTWVWAPYPSTGNVITSPGSGTITLSWTNVQNGDVFQLDQAGLTFPASEHTVANLATAPTPPAPPSVGSYAPAKGGRKRRFPIISTQLFNRQRSVYSIGTTHHETAPQF